MKKITLLSAIFFAFISLGFGQELLINGDLESWEDATHPTGWDVYQSIGQESTAENVHGGTYSASHSNVSKGTKKFRQAVSGIIPGESYTISFWYKTGYADGTDARMWSFWRSGGTNLTGENTPELRFYLPFTDGSWAQYTVTLTAPATADEFYFDVRTYSGVVNYWDDFSFFHNAAATVEAPVFTPPAGTYTTAQDIIITSATADASIYYTTDGTTPTTGSTLYEGPVHITSSTLFKAIAAVGTDESSVTTAAYVFPITVADIATLRTKPTGATLYILTGEAILTYQQNYRSQKFIQDATAGILIDDNSGNITTTYDIGDGITGIIGSLGAYQGMLQFKPVLDPGAATSTGNTITPVVLTVTEFVDNFETYEGMLVRVNGLTFDTGEEKADFANGTVYNTSDAASNILEFRTTFYNVDYIGEPIPTDVQDITGIANQRTGNYLTARFAADFDTEIVEAPVFTPPAGTYATAQDVAITSATAGAEIYYTLDGSNPTDASTPYTGTINVANNTTIKAIAYHDGMNESGIVSAEYIISATPPAVPLGSTGIIIAGLLLAAVVVVRKGRLF